MHNHILKNLMKLEPLNNLHRSIAQQIKDMVFVEYDKLCLLAVSNTFPKNPLEKEQPFTFRTSLYYIDSKSKASVAAMTEFSKHISLETSKKLSGKLMDTLHDLTKVSQETGKRFGVDFNMLTLTIKKDGSFNVKYATWNGGYR